MYDHFPNPILNKVGRHQRRGVPLYSGHSLRHILRRPCFYTQEVDKSLHKIPFHIAYEIAIYEARAQARLI